MTDRTDVWTYLSATSVTVPTDLTATYYSGLKTKITQTTDKYFRIESSSYNAGTGLTTINLNGFGIYTVANAPITAHSDMCAENVAGFPLAFEGSGRAGGQTITGGYCFWRRLYNPINFTCNKGLHHFWNIKI